MPIGFGSYLSSIAESPLLDGKLPFLLLAESSPAPGAVSLCLDTTAIGKI